MGPRGIAGGTREGHPLSRRHGLPLLNQQLAAMGIKAFQPSRVAALEVETVNRAVADIVYGSVGKGQNIRSVVHCQIHAVVKFLTTVYRVFPPAKVG